MLQKIFMKEDWYQLTDLHKTMDNNILRSKQMIFFADGMMDKIKYKKTRIMWFGFLNSGGERGIRTLETL